MDKDRDGNCRTFHTRPTDRGPSSSQDRRDRCWPLQSWCCWGVFCVVKTVQRVSIQMHLAFLLTFPLRCRRQPFWFRQQVGGRVSSRRRFQGCPSSYPVAAWPLNKKPRDGTWRYPPTPNLTQLTLVEPLSRADSMTASVTRAMQKGAEGKNCKVDNWIKDVNGTVSSNAWKGYQCNIT